MCRVVWFDLIGRIAGGFEPRRMVLKAKAYGSSRASATDRRPGRAPVWGGVGGFIPAGGALTAASSEATALRIAFGNQTIYARGPSNAPGHAETHGFASLPRGRFAFIVCNHRPVKERCRPLSDDHTFTLTVGSRVCQRPFFDTFSGRLRVKCGVRTESGSERVSSSDDGMYIVTTTRSLPLSVLS
jgi:hypothetical protein